MGGMFGGSGTTANTLTYLLWAMLRQPELVKRLRAELEAAFERDGGAVPAAATCANLPFLQAVINETLRLYPTIIATLPRKALRDTVVGGMHIPAGTIVGTQNYTIHQNETAFPDATSFLPERWLDVKNEEAMKEAFVPFSIGARACIGINLAKMEISKTASAFFLRFDAEVDGSMTPKQMEMYDVFSASPRGARLLLNLRDLGGGE
ncbi:cytochrome P450 [Neohortaea acidophila]|uniref:Cytochrome P450 n=1 Tax=Neohortaea acidophila TaxID=245834 RepID=A0A6A6PJC5_9PEZI|nr:cytochrome P450 [Neohortaea acidophila]KAF2479811.1 cytochrome P450 [Neohortaea acidophila]